jgi:hypothetical protein
MLQVVRVSFIVLILSSMENQFSIIVKIPKKHLNDQVHYVMYWGLCMHLLFTGSIWPCNKLCGFGFGTSVMRMWWIYVEVVENVLYESLASFFLVSAFSL